MTKKPGIVEYAELQARMLDDMRRAATMTYDEVVAQFSAAAGRPVGPSEKVLDVIAEIDRGASLAQPAQPPK